MFEPHRIAMAGFGNVGQALARLIIEGAAKGVDIVAVSDPRLGTVISQSALDPPTLLDAAGSGGFSALGEAVADTDVVGMIEAADAHTLVELTFTDLVTGEPATTHIRHALAKGWNVSTTNKGPIALHLEELQDLAAASGVELAFEGTVMSGSPVLLLAEESIREAGFEGLEGILNGTTNYIICRMEEGAGYEAALSECQSYGYAEADPSGDLEGHDAAAKLVILARVLTGRALPLAEVRTTPLGGLTEEDIRQASAAGERWRYVATLEKAGADSWAATVEARRLPASHPLSAVTGAANAVTFHTELLGAVTVVGPGAGPTETAYAVLTDLRRIEQARTL